MYYDMLIRIKNAQAAKKGSLKLPYSTMDMAVAEILVVKNYLKSAVRKGRGGKRVIELVLTDAPAINGVRLVSKASRAIYAGSPDRRSVKSGHGIAGLSTAKGLRAG